MIFGLSTHKFVLQLKQRRSARMLSSIMSNPTRALAVQMVEAASITNSKAEQDFPDVLMRLIGQEGYFQAHPELLWSPKIANDPHGRRNVCALVRGSGRKTVVLTGHYDVVSTDNYGPLEPWAFSPEILCQKIMEDLRQNARSQAEQLALQDLESGLYLPGRGLLDMKSGLAAGLTALFQFSKLENQIGNVLFLAVADEEDRSHGARVASSLLKELDLDVVGVINLDATSDTGDGSAGQALYLGSVGKLLVSALVIGVDTHAGYALDGINANFLVSALNMAFEGNPHLTDQSLGEIGTPPTSLKQTDQKLQYDVTTPARAWLCMNVLTHGLSAKEVLERFTREARTAIDNALQALRTRAEALGAKSAAHGAAPLVLTYQELLERCQKQAGFLHRLEQFCNQLEPRLDLPSQSQQVLNWLWDQSGLLGPAVVLGFASLHYPSTFLPREHSFVRSIQKSLEKTQETLGVTVTERSFFRGISDMSWFGQANTEDIEFVNKNTAAPLARIETMPAQLPVVNLGPWGRDYHQWLERVYMPYAFEHLPNILEQILLDVFNSSDV